MSSYNSAALLGGQRLEKGSTAAKARMAYLRSLRGKKLHAGAVPACGGKRVTKKGMRGGALLDAQGIFNLIKKGIGFWGKWGSTNIGGLINYIKNKKERQKVIDALKKLPKDELKKFQKMMREKREKGEKVDSLQPPAPIQQKSAVELAKEEARRRYEEAVKERDRRIQEVLHKKWERSKKKPVIKKRVTDDYDYDERQPDNTQDIEDAVDDTDDMVSIPPDMFSGGKLSGRDWTDIFLGPYGWAALASRKIQEKKAKKQQKELESLMYGDE